MVPSIIDVWGYDREFCSSSPPSSSYFLNHCCFKTGFLRQVLVLFRYWFCLICSRFKCLFGTWLYCPPPSSSPLPLPPALEKASHWQRHCHSDLPGAGLHSVLTQRHPLPLPTHLRRRQSRESRHRLHQIPVSRFLLINRDGGWFTRQLINNVWGSNFLFLL